MDGEIGTGRLARDVEGDGGRPSWTDVPVFGHRPTDTHTVVRPSAYALVTAGRLHGPGLTFQLMNLFGGAFLMINSAYYGAWPSAALNVVWVVIGLVGLTRARLRAATSAVVED